MKQMLIKKKKKQRLVNYNNTYTLSKGIDLADKDGKVFDVCLLLVEQSFRRKKIQFSVTLLKLNMKMDCLLFINRCLK